MNKRGMILLPCQLFKQLGITIYTFQYDFDNYNDSTVYITAQINSYPMKVGLAFRASAVAGRV
jgi:hypothetical protein